MRQQQQQISSDEVFRILACRQRRLLLRRLREAGGALERGELTERLEGAGLTDVAVTLSHRDLPMLAEHGLVEYDTQGGVVTYHPDEFVEQLLAVSQSR